MSHVPVLLQDVLTALRESPRELKLFLDGTFGRGGHTSAIMQDFPDLRVVAFDRDETAIKFANENFPKDIQDGRLKLIHRNFTTVDEAEVGNFDAILLDLGVSSPQLDEAERGFSFYNDGPLDMRMDRRDTITAASIVNEWEEDALFELFREFGEISRPGRVVSAIVRDRKTVPFTTTRQLASLVERIEGWTRKGHHPATRFFMALRLQVNHELEDVQNGVLKMMNHLEPGGRLLVITFHSLEDRIVKNLFREAEATGSRVNKKVIKATYEEQKKNSRARSAQLRIFERSQS